MTKLKKEMSMSLMQKILVVPMAALACATVASGAAAQIDTNPPEQNVMLLVDTSGSMEFAPDGTKVQCDQVDGSLTGEPKGASTRNRWTQLVEVLTGDVKDYGCYTEDRRGDQFRDEFKLSNVNAYDYNYHVPYHRITSGTPATGGACTVGPGDLTANPFLWGTSPFKYHLWNSPTTACTNFSQAQTGLLDTYRDRLRFGLMTFDTSVNAGTGLSGSAADYASGMLGTWSYFLNWRGQPDCTANGNCARGRPAGCDTLSDMEVGARNAAAPPWEGRMVPFGSPVASSTDVRTTNDHIQQVLTAVRPFGATPIEGLLSDARDFFRSDDDDDYTTGQICDRTTGIGCFGPKFDASVRLGCRSNNVILLTDGEPNLDLRPYCEAPDPGAAHNDGKCPFKNKPADIAQDLAHPSSGTPITTYVIGFAVSTITAGSLATVDCSQISSGGTNGVGGTFDVAHVCDPATMKPELKACCTLAEIAFKGGSTNAYFASNATDLRKAMSDILSKLGTTVSTRTMPVFASAAGQQLGGSYSFLTSFRVDPGAPWSGVLERQRTECHSNTSGTATIITPDDEPIDGNQGDKFSDNVNAADSTHPRQFYTVIPDPRLDGTVPTDSSIRPFYASPTDGVVSSSSVTVRTGTIADFFGSPRVSAGAMQINKSACHDLPLPATDDLCAQMFMKWELAIDNGPYAKRDNAFGAIYHSTPVVVGAPGEFLRDESYTQFVSTQFKRPPVLYTSTTDGQLHAFKVEASPNDPTDTFTVNKKANNELWSFFPPAALPRIPAQYPNTQQVILDGVPVVKDVVFQRTTADAKNGGATAAWNTVLVSGFGGGGTGYFALDITNPVPKAGNANTGPQMLWQLTTDASNNRLFGKRSGTPVITTLYFGQNGATPQEYAVAILPGGESDGPIIGAGPLAAGCPQLGAPSGQPNLVDPSFRARSKVHCWNADPARSLTIVMLKTGEIVRSFRSVIDGPASILPRSVNTSRAYTSLDAPISGQPIVFPSTTGAVADRAFVGDSDGMLWRIDLAASDPLKWKMELFFDAYTGKAFDAGQPIATPPILSVDRIGDVTVAFSTGDQETFAATAGMTNFIWSLRENPIGATPFQSEAQWYQHLDNGERVSGPMSLFASNLYYTTFTPPPAAKDQQCSNGQSRLCAVNYLVKASPDGSGGAPAVPPLDPAHANDACLPPLSNSIVFGAGITQKPTCNSETAYPDPYFGNNGSHAGLTNINPGKFVLTLQTGPGGTAQAGGEVKTKTMELAPPMTSTRIDSWAAVVE